MRLIVACVNALSLDSHTDNHERAERVGLALAELLSLPRVRYGADAGRYRTSAGSKTAAGLARTVARLLLEGGPI